MAVTSSSARTRRAYIDWLRGVAVVIMFLAHTTDAWTRVEERPTPIYQLSVKVSGMGAPLFLFLAGVAVALASGARARKGADLRAATAAVRRRGWEIFGLALVLRLQSWTLGAFRAPAASMLKVDILNIMGPAIAAAATVWAIVPRAWGRVATFSLVAIAIALATPPIRAAAWPALLPDAVEWYIRPPKGLSWFALFPWAGLLFAGAAIGVLIDASRDEASERRLNATFLGLGTALCAGAWVGAHLPPLHTNSSFWTTSISYFVFRIGLMIAMLGAAYFWLRRPTAWRWSPALVLGTSSLFVYWVHLDLVYGGLARPLRRALPFGWVMVALAAFTAFMVGLTLVKNDLVARWKARRSTGSLTSSQDRSVRGANAG
jgi:uncharacterized membrane protein